MRLLGAGARILSGRLVQVAANATVVFLVAKALGPTGQGHYSLTVAVSQLAAALLAGGMGLAAVPPLRRDRLPAGRMVSVQGAWTGATGLILLAAAALAGGGAVGRALSAVRRGGTRTLSPVSSRRVGRTLPPLTRTSPLRSAR